MKVLWTEAAVANLQDIHDYIARTSPEYALRIVDKLTLRSQLIAEFPESGRPVPEYETKRIREILEGAYRIIYYIESDQIEILAVLHAARLIQP